MLRSQWQYFVCLFSQADRRKLSPIPYFVLFLGGLGILLATYGPLSAAVELSAYDVLVLPTGVVLEWQTVSEYDLIGFEVWYKEEVASQSAYKLLGKRIAQGSPNRGVTYRMDVTHLLKADTPYCFQLRELPINGARGEILNRCGYGVGISAQPTPTPTPIFTPTSEFGITTDGFTAPTDFTPSFTETVDPFSTFTDSNAVEPSTVDPMAPPPTDPFPLPPTDPNNPGAGGEFVWPTETPTPIALSMMPTPPFDSQGFPTPVFPDAPSESFFPTPTLPFTMTDPGASSSSVLEGTTDGLLTDVFTQAVPLTETSDFGSPSPFDSVLPTPTSPPAVANPPYIVLTATPTTAAIASAPTFTPYPTMPPQPEVTLLGIQVPDTQNLMIMLLCGVFSGASGLGILGLVSTLLYMRSRASRGQQRTTQHRF